ncbi:MAG: hypothetical protein R3320_09375 [Nitriliruptorales bacterium]|nr:hypothetical protein [Nitriliruptorales bacterium]
MSTSGRDPQRDETRVIRDDRGGSRSTESHRTPGWWESADPYTLVAIVGSVVGVIALIIGIVTIARTGIPANDITGATTAVGPFDRTALMGIIEIIIGLAYIGAGASRNSSALFALGLVSGVFGVVWLIEPNAFNDALGVNRATAWLYLLFGIVASIVGGWAGNYEDRVVIQR